jgi:hypothetical protein
MPAQRLDRRGTVEQRRLHPAEGGENLAPRVGGPRARAGAFEQRHASERFLQQAELLRHRPAA